MRGNPTILHLLAEMFDAVLAVVELVGGGVSMMEPCLDEAVRQTPQDAKRVRRAVFCPRHGVFSKGIQGHLSK